MNHDMMQGGWMMGGMMVVMLLFVTFLIAGIAYFVTGTLSRHGPETATTGRTDHDSH